MPKQNLAPDLDAVRAKYREEREKRLRADGNEQYIDMSGDYARYLDDPYVEPGFSREPLSCTAGGPTRRAAIGDAEYDTIFAEGAALSPDTAVNRALAVIEKLIVEEGDE